LVTGDVKRDGLIELGLMANYCRICRHPDRWRLELLRAGGASIDALAAKFGVSRDSVYRHWERHVSDEAKAGYLCGPIELEKLAERAALEGDSVLDYLRLIRTSLTGQLAAMTEAGDGRGAAYVADKLRMVLETIAKVTGELAGLAQSATYNFTSNTMVMNEHPAFLKIQATMLRALAPHPAARAGVVRALRSLDEENAQAPAAAKVIEHQPPIEGNHAA
jgi:hypothetical protein